MAPSTAAPFTVTDEQKQQFHEEGWFLIERALPEAHLELLQREADRAVAEKDRQVEAGRAQKVQGITHYRKKYFLGGRSQDPANAALREVLFNDVYAAICRAAIGPEAYLFCEQFVVKHRDAGSTFAWHQDSGYVGHEHTPYLTCWTALDDVDEANGTVYVLPYSRGSSRRILDHEAETGSNDLVGYDGDDPGIPVIAPAGSIAVFSSRTLHRSSANTTDRPRRGYVPQYSPEPITDAEGTRLWNMAVPFLANGEVVADPAAPPRPAREALATAP